MEPVFYGTSFFSMDKVLIIDDEQDICFMLSLMLKKKNLESKVAHSLTEGKSLIEKEKPNLIFLDNNLPDGLGIDAIPELKKQFPEVKIIVITANDTTDNRKDAIQNGANAFIGKPFTGQKIFSAIESVTS